VNRFTGAPPGKRAWLPAVHSETRRTPGGGFAADNCRCGSSDKVDYITGPIIGVKGGKTACETSAPQREKRDERFPKRRTKRCHRGVRYVFNKRDLCCREPLLGAHNYISIALTSKPGRKGLFSGS